MDRSTFPNTVRPALLSSSAGFVSFMLIAYTFCGAEFNTGSFFGVVREAIEHVCVKPLLFVFFLFGCLWGWLFARQWVIAGFASMGFFYLIALVESILVRGSHNLLPFEFIFYALYSLPCCFGGFLTKTLRAKLDGEPDKAQKEGPNTPPESTSHH